MLRPDEVFIRRSISSPPATTDPSVRQLLCWHFMVGDQREGETHGLPSKYWNVIVKSFAKPF